MIVAVKVVEHTQYEKNQAEWPNVVEIKGTSEIDVAREVLLSTSVAHPNVIATYKICTICVGKVSDSGMPGNPQVWLPFL